MKLIASCNHPQRKLLLKTNVIFFVLRFVMYIAGKRDVKKPATRIHRIHHVE